MAVSKADQLKRAIEVINSGKRPMRGTVFMDCFGENHKQYEFDGKFFDTKEQLQRYLEDFEVIDGRGVVIMYYPDDIPDYEGD